MNRNSAVWHPFTQHAVQPEATLIAEAEGAWLQTPDGRRIFDAVSSWWVVTHGHRHPHIVQAIKNQIDRLDQVIFAGFTHEPAETLARQLDCDHAAGTRIRVLLRQRIDLGRSRAENGARLLAASRRASAAAFWRWKAPITAIPSAACRSASAASSTRLMSPLLFDVERLPFPARRRANRRRSMRWRRHAERGAVAALIVEPLILGAGGMLIYPPWVLAEMKRVCRSPRRSVDRRRSDDRLGPHRNAVRVRAGGRDARHRLLLQGTDRRFAAARRDALPRAIFSTRIIRQTGPGPSFIPVRIRPIPSPAPPPWRIWRCGRPNR